MDIEDLRNEASTSLCRHYRKADRISSASLGINQRLTAVHAIAQNNARDVVTLIQCSEGLSPMAVRLEALGAAFAVKS